MKKYILLTMATAFLACGVVKATPKKEKANQNTEEHSEYVQPNIDDQVKMYVEHPIEPPFRLNGTEKWNADEFTEKAIGILKAMTEDFLSKKGTDYKHLGNELQKIAVSVIDENKAGDPDRGAIMAYMAPIIGNTDMIRKVNSKELAGKVLILMKKKLGEFDKFFK